MEVLDYPHDLVTEVSAALLADGPKILQGNRLGKTDLMHVATLASYMWLPQGAAVADIGCGFGEVARILGTIRHDLTLHLVNSNLFQMQHRTCDTPYAYVADMHSLPLADSSVDVAMYCYSLCHADQGAALREAWRVTHPGGGLFIYDYERVAGDDRAAERHLYARFPFARDMRHTLRDAGWVITGQEQVQRDESGWDLVRTDMLTDILSDLVPVIWTARKPC